MFRPARLLMLAALALAVYFVFYAVPGGTIAPGRFDPDKVAAREAAMWQALDAREDIGIYLNATMLQRELHQYTWFRAVQAAYYTARAMRDFSGMQHRYERVLPDLEAAAAIEKTWRSASFEAPDLARAQLNWWVARKTAHLNTRYSISELIAEEYEVRYGPGFGSYSTAASIRAQAWQLHDDNRLDPDWRAITKLLTESYRALREALGQNRALVAG